MTSRQYTVVCDISDIDRWSEVLLLCDDVVGIYNIDLKTLELRYDPEAMGPNIGDANLETKTIRLLTPDKNILLHELAHIYANEKHTEEWAKIYLALLRMFLEGEEFADALATASSMYAVVGDIVKSLAANEWIEESDRWTWGTPWSGRERKVTKRSSGMVMSGKGTVRQYNDRREKARSKRKGDDPA